MLANLASMSSLNLFKAAVQFGVSMLLALYVLPAEYGLVTFSLPIIQFIALFTDMGLGSAIIRQPSLSRDEAGGALSFSLTVAVAAAALLVTMAWPVARWSGLSGLGPVLAALAGAVLFTIVAGVPRAIMERALHYRRIALIEAGSVIVAAGAFAFTLLSGGGIWSMVVFHITLQSSRAAAFYSGTRRSFRLHLRWGSVKGLLSFGGWVLATNLVNFFGRNAQNILIGAWLGASAVGLYGLAYQFMILPLMAMAWPASGVLMATLSRISGNGTMSHFRQPVLAVSMVTALITFPIMVYLTFGLGWPIARLMSPHWREVTPLLAVLAPLGALQSLAAYNGAVLIARGHARLQFHVNLWSSLALLAGFFSSLPFGLRSFAFTYLVVGGLVAVAQIYAKLWAAEVSVYAYLKAIAPALCATAAGLAAAALTGLRPESWLGWFVSTSSYGVAMLVVLVMMRSTVIAAVRDLLGTQRDVPSPEVGLVAETLAPEGTVAAGLAAS